MTSNSERIRQRLKYWHLVLAMVLVGCGGGQVTDAPGPAPVGSTQEVDGRVFITGADGEAHPLIPLEDVQASRVSGLGRDVRALGVTPPPVRYSLAGFQTPQRNQRGRGTCQAFAGVAALEAAYKRTYGVTLDLSEQYAFHLAKSGGVDQPRFFDYENQSSHWGGGGPGFIAHTLTEHAIPREESAPYLDEPDLVRVRANNNCGALAWHWDPAVNKVTQKQIDACEYAESFIPQAAREKATYRAVGYEIIQPGVAAIEAAIASDKEVILGINLKWKRDPVTGVMVYDQSSPGGGHVFLVVGYDRESQRFTVKNSHGEAGLILVSYDFVARTAGEAVVLSGAAPPWTATTLRSKWIGHWYLDNDGWRSELVIRRAPEGSTPTRLGHLYAADGSLKAVNGYFQDGGRRLVMWVAASRDAALNDVSGQRFEHLLYGQVPRWASGTTAWSNLLFGTLLSRRNEGPFLSSIKDPWLGSWTLNVNGSEGAERLLITSTQGGTVIGSASSGSAISGTLLNDNTVSLSLAGQPYTLRRFTRESGRASGTGTVNGVQVGVHAVRP